MFQVQKFKDSMDNLIIFLIISLLIKTKDESCYKMSVDVVLGEIQKPVNFQESSDEKGFTVTCTNSNKLLAPDFLIQASRHIYDYIVLLD